MGILAYITRAFSSIFRDSDMPPKASTSAPVRRTPIGKVIHPWADTQSQENPQGYDGYKFQEYYHALVLNPEGERDGVSVAAAAGAGAGSSGNGSGEGKQKAKGSNSGADADAGGGGGGEGKAIDVPAQALEEMVRLTGLTKAEAKKMFKRGGGSTMDAALTEYLRQSSSRAQATVTAAT